MDDLDPLIHQATRLRIMTILHRNREASFAWVQHALQLTPGNLDSHLAKLTEAGYLQYGTNLTPHGFENRVRLTAEGSRAFNDYLSALARLLADASVAQKKDADK